MVKNAELLDRFEREIINKKPDFQKNLEIYEAMLEEARLLGIFPLKDPMDGVDDDIRVSRILNRLP